MRLRQETAISNVVYCDAAFPFVFWRCGAHSVALHAWRWGSLFFFFFSFTSQLLVYDVRIFVGILGSYGSPIKRDGMGIAGIVVVF